MNFCLIADKPVSTHVLEPILRRFGALRSVHISEMKPETIRITDLTVIDADLHLKENLGAIRRLLDHRSTTGASGGVVAIIASDAEREHVQAWSLGCDVVLRRGRQAVDLERLLSGESGAPLVIGDVKTNAAVQAASLALAGLFDAATHEHALDDGQFLRACASIEEALADASLREWISAAVQHHAPTLRHSLLVAGVTCAISLQTGVGPDERRLLVKGAVLHDIGKSRISLDILDKAAALSDEEIQIMRSHTVIGGDIVRSNFPAGDVLYAIARNHHEMLDGSGYPDGLKGAQISMPVRIVTVADVFAALIERRSYKPSISQHVAYAIVAGNSSKFDPGVVRALGAAIQQ